MKKLLQGLATAALALALFISPASAAEKFHWNLAMS